MRYLRLALIAALIFAGAPARAKELVLGLATDITSADPHFHNTSSNNAASRHVFDTLIRQDPRQRLLPGLAVSWRARDALTWEIELREGVRFHDGSTFGPEDVVASLRRAGNVAGSPSSFGIYTRGIVAAEIAGPRTLLLRTAAPAPLLPNDLSLVPIVQRRFVDAPTEAFNSGAAAIGTGPFRLVRFAPGERMELARFDGHWGGAAPWSSVKLLFLRNGAQRAAALLAGNVQAIEAPPPSAMAELRRHPNVAISSVASNRIMFLFPDTGRERTPYATDRRGLPLERNPLRDLRVRQALSAAIDRKALVERALEGEGSEAGQLLPEGYFGVSPRLGPDPYDPARARRLLAEAGWPEGFGLTLHGPNDRFVNDGAVVQAIAAMFAQAGIDARAETMPWAVFATRASRPEFSLILVGWGAGTGEPSSPMRGLLATYDPTSGLGASNRGRWSNALFDRLLARGLSEFEPERREATLIDATELAIGDLGLIPLYHERATWAVRRGLSHTARADQYTLATDFRLAP
ncbi:MAG: ABC transporter substrate-binding protein [Tagaea sp.]